jgi:hypothetical protein
MKKAKRGGQNKLFFLAGIYNITVHDVSLKQGKKRRKMDL